MSKEDSSCGCGCLLLFVAACWAGGGVWEGLAIMTGLFLLFMLACAIIGGLFARVLKFFAGD